MKISTLILMLFFIAEFSFASENTIMVRKIDSVTLLNKLDSLLLNVTAKKDVPENLELSFFAALLHYELLYQTPIRFKYSKIKTTLNVRPTLVSVLFRKKENRKYVIRINTSNAHGCIGIENVPFNARVGLLGHELAHIVDYGSLTIPQLFKRGLSYLNAEDKAEYEKWIDLRTVEAGLGWQLYDWANYIQQQPDISEDYKAYKKRTYLQSKTIAQKIVKQKQKLEKEVDYSDL